MISVTSRHAVTGATLPRLVLLASLSSAVLPVSASADGVAPAKPCPIAPDVVRLDLPLPQTTRRLVSGETIKIVAIGSSSTAGAGASSPAGSYPSRLAVELGRRLQNDRISVVNLGVNGEEATDMVARFEAVLAEKPDLVLWQVGTNSVLRDSSTDAASSVIRAGIGALKAAGTDVLLVDPQYAPRVLAKPETEAMVRRLDVIGKENHVGVFYRFAMMRRWHEVEGIAFNDFIAPDGLHLNDWSYACWARTMALAIADTATRPVATAVARPSGR